MQLICVVMAASTRDSRNEIAKKLFDFGFAGYRYVEFPSNCLETVAIKGSVETELPLCYGEYKTVIEKKNGEVKTEISLPEYVSAPIKAGDTVGTVKYTLNGETLAELPITAAVNIERIDFRSQFLRLLKTMLY